MLTFPTYRKLLILADSLGDPSTGELKWNEGIQIILFGIHLRKWNEKRFTCIYKW